MVDEETAYVVKPRGGLMMSQQTRQTANERYALRLRREADASYLAAEAAYWQEYLEYRRRNSLLNRLARLFRHPTNSS